MWLFELEELHKTLLLLHIYLKNVDFPDVDFNFMLTSSYTLYLSFLSSLVNLLDCLLVAFLWSHGMQSVKDLTNISFPSKAVILKIIFVSFKVELKSNDFYKLQKLIPEKFVHFYQMGKLIPKMSRVTYM